MSEFRQRPLSTGHHVVLAVAVLTSLILMNNVFIESGIWRTLFEQTYGLIHPTLQANVLMLTVLYLILVRLGRLTFGELGLRWTDLPSAIGWGMVVWICVQLTLAVFAVANDGLHIHPHWLSLATVLQRVGEFGGQVFGNALSEEILWRGFLFVQCLVLLHASGDDPAAMAARSTKSINSRTTPAKQKLLAMLIVACIFAVSHIPNRIMKGRYVSFDAVISDQLFLFVAGAWFCWFYLRTGNLILAVIVHALVNKTMVLWSGHQSAGELVLIWATMIALLDPLFRPLIRPRNRPDDSSTALHPA